MICWFVYRESKPRSLRCSPIPLPTFLALYVPKSLRLNLFADPHHLNPSASIFYKKARGRGVSLLHYLLTSSSLSPYPATLPENHLLSPIIATDPKSPSNNPFVCHTSDTPRGSSYERLSTFVSQVYPPISHRLASLAYCAFL